MKKIIASAIVSLLVIVTLIALGFFINQKFEKLHDEVISNSKSIYEISSGMSIDEKRLRATKQTEAIIQKYNKDYRRNFSEEFIHSMAMSIVDAASRYPNLNHLDLVSVIVQESRFNHKAISPLGAKGLMQIMDGTSEMICYRFAWAYNDSIALNPEKNILMGAYYLNYLIDRFGDLEIALAHYNGGERHGTRYKLKKQIENGILMDSVSIDAVSLLAKETANYPVSVLNIRKNLEKQFNYIRGE